MTTYKKGFYSIVFRGSHNPQILNHDFLLKNNILPIDKEPFRSFLADASGGKKSFSEFLSTPPVTSLRYKYISIIVDQTRYQIVDNNYEIPSESPIIQITKLYFGKYLKHTPLILGGLNFQGHLSFNDENDKILFDSKLGIELSKVEIPFSDNYPQFDIRIRFPWHSGRIEVRVDKVDDEGLKGTINFNYEFKYNDIDSFIATLDQTDYIHEKHLEVLSNLNVEVIDA